MAWTEFYMDTATGSDLNAGSTTGAAAHTYASGTLATVSTTATFTVASGNPQSDGVAVGDWISMYPDANTTTPFISQVTSVTSTTIVCDTTANAFGTVPSNGTSNRTVKHGGAWADLGMLASGVALNTGTIPISIRINIKAGTYANTSTGRTFGLAGNATKLIWWRGYKTTIGDQDLNNTCVAGTDIPTLTFTTGQINVSGTGQIFSSIDVSSACVTTSGAFVINSSSRTDLYRVRVTNTAANSLARSFTVTGVGSLTGCYLKCTNTSNVNVVMNGTTRMTGTVITGGIIGVSVAASGSAITFNVFDSQAGDAIQVTSNIQAMIENNSFYAPTGNGINFLSTINVQGSIVANNYFENVNQAGKAAINNTSGTNTGLILAVGNAYFNCTSNTSGLTESFTIFDNGTLASAAFTNPGSQDFSITSIGKALGYPGTFECISAYTGYLDIGAVQRIEGSTIINSME